MDARYAGILPVEVAVGRRGEEAVKARGIGAIARDHFVRADDISQALRHFGAVFDHHALGKEAFDRFVVGDETEIAHELRPEARIDQMQNRVLNSANILIDGKPILRGPRTKRRVVVVRVGVAVEVPGRIDEGVHGVGFAARRTSTLRASRIYELR